jgi:AraC-like DNA-binding protein
MRAMISIPLPFVISLVLLAVLIRMVRQGEAELRESRMFLALIAAYTAQSLLIGLRWGYGITAIMPLQAVLAAAIAPLAYLCFRQLVADAPSLSSPRTRLHGLSPLAIAVLFAVWRDPVGPLIILIFLGYGVGLFWLARRGPDGLVFSRLDGIIRSYRSLQLTAAALIGSALADIAISYDFLSSGGRHAGAIVAAGNVLSLLALGAAASIAGQSAARDRAGEEEENAPPHQPAVSDADSLVAAELDQLIRSRQLYRDADLNLAKIARKLGIPARQVSNAVNRVHAMSVSQYVNNFRVEAACRMLEGSDEPVTRIVFESGFQTKSNFNREFLRVTGRNPTAWRRERGQLPDNVERLERKAAS